MEWKGEEKGGPSLQNIINCRPAISRVELELTEDGATVTNVVTAIGDCLTMYLFAQNRIPMSLRDGRMILKV